MTTAIDYLYSVMESLKIARASLTTLTTFPANPGFVGGYEKACQNNADAVELAVCFNAIALSQCEVEEAIDILEGKS